MARRSIIGAIVELAILIGFAYLLWKYNFTITLVFYLIAVFVALWKGLIFKRRNISWMIIFGTMLSYLAGLLFWRALGSYLAGDITSAIILGLFILWLWTKGMKLKLGKK
jgi:hypothetical protein